MTDTAVIPAETGLDLALLKALGWDRLAPEQRELALAISRRYDLDPMLRHVVIIEGRPFVTRDALLWIAHRSGQFDGIEVTDPEVVNGVWKCWASVWRKDMSHVVRYPGRYPTTGGNQKYAPEMAIKVAESMALRRAFNVAAPVAEERWDMEAAAQELSSPPPPRPTLAERAAAKAAEVEPLLAEPMTPDESAEIVVETPGLTVEQFKDVCVRGGKSTVAIAKAIDTTPDRVGARVKAMTDVERAVLADELGLDWRR